jgi:hypothetical protein
MSFAPRNNVSSVGIAAFFRNGKTSWIDLLESLSCRKDIVIQISCQDALAENILKVEEARENEYTKIN